MTDHIIDFQLINIDRSSLTVGLIVHAGEWHDQSSLMKHGTSGASDL